MEMASAIVQTTHGKIQGTPRDGAIAYLGVPFAKPPVGELRFRAPQPVDPWDGVFVADKFKPNPLQINLIYPVESYSEDCLYLNVWIPEDKAGKVDKLPVMVWIPGGSFKTGGSGAITPEGPSGYEFGRVAKDMGCIVVSTSYRLNAFGFLNMAKYSDRFDDNLGIKDIIATLRWVKHEIAAFGGDPENVTACGHSAGAGLVAALMMCDEARPYFQKAIMQSCCFGSYYTPQEEDDLVEKFLAGLGLTTAEVDKVLDLDGKALLNNYPNVASAVGSSNAGKCLYCPVVDGEFIKDMPTLARFEAQNIPVLVGTTLNEGNYFTVTYLGDKQFFVDNVDKVFQHLSPEHKAQVRHAYPEKLDLIAAGDILTDVMYKIPTLRFAEHYSQHNTVYVYRYDYVTPYMTQAGLRVSHVAELVPLLDLKAEPFGSWGKGVEDVLGNIGNRLRRYWSEFVRIGVPATNWKPYDEEDRYTMVIDEEDQLLRDPDEFKRKAYEGIVRILV